MTAIQFPGLAASSGHNCLQVDNSGYVTNTGQPAAQEAQQHGQCRNSGQIAITTGVERHSPALTRFSSAGGTELQRLQARWRTWAELRSREQRLRAGECLDDALSSEQREHWPRYDVTNSAFGAVGTA